MNYPFLKEEVFNLRTQETFVGNSCEIYLPTSFFDKNDPNALSAIVGDRISTIGIFYFKVDGTLYKLQLPLFFEFQFSDVNKKKFKIKPEIPEIEYNVYTLKKGDAFVYDILHRQNVDDFKNFMNKLIEGAKMPAYVSYTDVLPIFLTAMTSSKATDLGIDSVTAEFLLSELYRGKKQMHDPFRLAYNGHNNFDYRMVNITKVPQLTSTFTSMSGEDITTQFASSIVKQRDPSKKGINKESPIEKLIKY